jgi:Phosphotransferase enzyme family
MAVEDFLGGISRDGLCTIASRYNNGIQCSSDPSTCIPTFGTFNVVIPLHFENGSKWIARIPRPGRMFTSPNPALLERIMHSLVMTTTLVRERTCIPVPAIHGWSSHEDNEAGCPYMFMDFVEGKSLGDCLQDLPADKTSNIIYEWAMYTWELTRLTFPAIGCIGINRETERIGVQKYISAGSVDQGRDGISPFYRGPYTSVADYLFGISNLKKLAPQDDVSYDRFSFGTYLESMIPFALKPEWNKGPFCLAHDDLNVQNILVDPDLGRITAILDWDYACVKPLQSLIAYPESLRWDLLSPVNNTFEPYQIEWARTYRSQWADGMILASKQIMTGCKVNVAAFLDDSPFYAELERGLGESWREAEAMKFCNAIVYGGKSNDVLKLAGRNMRCGPWMSRYGYHAGYNIPLDLEASQCSPVSTKRQSIMGKVRSSMTLRRGAKSVASTNVCEWKSFREKFLHRKRIRRFLGRLRQELRQEEDDVSLNGSIIEKSDTLEKRASWWSGFGRRFYGVKERTLELD